MVINGSMLLAPIPSVVPVLHFYTLFPQTYIYTVKIYTWVPVASINPIYPVPAPVWITSTPIVANSCCENEIARISPITNELKHEAIEDSSFKECESPAASDYNVEKIEAVNEEESENEFNKVIERNNKISKSIETYMDLPRELFPPARTFTVDPNPLIDEFCKFCDIQKHASWILDLEFGIPNCLITRPIPMYNVKYNSVNCKNAPEAVHPGFESCNQNFKRAFLYYYDGIISTWYRGFTLMNNDKSVENFQAWILIPMQTLGMCWP